MTWEDFWAPNLVQSLVFGSLTAIVGFSVRGLLAQRRQLRAILQAVGAPDPTEPPARLPFRLVDMKRYRKAVALGLGFMLTGVLTWASTAGVLEGLLAPFLMPQLRPLVGVLVGGIATMVAVIRATNEPAPGVRRAGTLEVPAPPVAGAMDGALESTEPAGTVLEAAVDATPPAPTATTAALEDEDRAWWSGVVASEPEAHTSRVELLPAPSRTYQ